MIPFGRVSSPPIRPSTVFCFFFLLSFLFPYPFSLGGETVFVVAGRDTTLIENPEGELANGSGPFVFVGRTSQQRDSIRRALLFFDVAAVVPSDGIITGVSLTLYMFPSNTQPREIELHRVQADWGEGNSVSPGGGGAASEPKDATWIHTFYDSEFWVHTGGQYLNRPSAIQEIGEPGFYTWSNGPHLVRDVRLWLKAPRRNFGWILVGDETTPQNAKSFASRENPDPSLRPVLEISFRRPGVP